MKKLATLIAVVIGFGTMGMFTPESADARQARVLVGYDHRGRPVYEKVHVNRRDYYPRERFTRGRGDVIIYNERTRRAPRVGVTIGF